MLSSAPKFGPTFAPGPVAGGNGKRTPVNLLTPVVQRWIDEGTRDPEGLWARAAAELPWFRTWDRTFEWTLDAPAPDAVAAPAFRRFSGARTNLAYNALDHHVDRGRGGHAALVYVNERGD